MDTRRARGGAGAAEASRDAGAGLAAGTEFGVGGGFGADSDSGSGSGADAHPGARWGVAPAPSTAGASAGAGADAFRGVDTLETRELRYFIAVAEELHFGRAAERLGMAQPPLSRAIQQLERRLGVTLLVRNRRGVSLTAAGEVLLHEGRAALDAATAAARRTRRAGGADDAAAYDTAAGGAGGGSGTGGRRNRLMLAVKTGSSHQLLDKLLSAYAAEPGAVEVEVLQCNICEQGDMLRDGRADAALMHMPFNSLVGFDSEPLLTEGQIAILPAAHPLAARATLTTDEIADVPDLPLARWPARGVEPPGRGPVIENLTQIAQLIALGRAVAVFPDSARSWLWPEHAAVPLTDAPPVVTHIAWPPHSRSLPLAHLVRAASRL